MVQHNKETGDGLKKKKKSLYEWLFNPIALKFSKYLKSVQNTDFVKVQFVFYQSNH